MKFAADSSDSSDSFGRIPDKDPVVKESPMTYDDYAAIPDDGNRYELAGGTLEMMSPAPTTIHQWFSIQMYDTLKESCGEQYFIFYAPIDVILSPHEVRQPDLVMIHHSRMHILSKRGIEGPPDLVVEILSPHSLKRDKISKTKVYARYGVPEYWIADPVGGTLEQYVQAGGSGLYELVDVYIGDESIRSERLRCVSFTMSEIMSRIPDLPD